MVPPREWFKKIFGPFFLFRSAFPEIFKVFHSTAQRNASARLAPPAIQNIPAIFSRSPTTLRQAPSTTPESAGKPAARQ